MARQPQPARTEARALIEQQGSHLIVRTRPGEDVPWELPGGVLAPGESPEAGLRRCCREQLGIAVDVQIGQPPIEHVIDGQTVRFRYYMCGLGDEPPQQRGVAELRWVLTAQLRDYVFGPVDQQVINWLLDVEMY